MNPDLQKKLLAILAITSITLCAKALPADDPLIQDDERHLASNDPDRFAWILFERVNQAVPDDPQKRVLWETWALAGDVFATPDTAPEWSGTDAAERQTEKLQSRPLQQEILDAAQSHGELRPQFSELHALGQFNETRMNRATFDFVVDNELYNVEGQEKVFAEGGTIDFPLDAMETKAQWRRITAEQAKHYHTATTINSDESKQLWGLTSLHITTKDLPDWFWCTFEHVDNPGREAVVPDRDSHGRPDEFDGTKWEYYVLRGSQTNYVDAVGRTTILASSQIERGFQRTSSCITCHARATIGERARQRPGNPAPPANRLTVFEDSGGGSTGIPDARWFMDIDRVPQSRGYIQTDFVWSLFRAQRKTPPGAAVVEAEQVSPKNVGPRRDPVRQFDGPPDVGAELAEVRPLIRSDEASAQFQVRGKGLTVAVLDTGLRSTHVDFAGRVAAQVNFTSDNGGDLNDASDGNGHGTNVAGIIVSNADHRGIAPAARVIPIKVLSNTGGGSFAAIQQGLEWVLSHRAQHDISVVNMSLGDSGNYTSDNFGNDEIGNVIKSLRDARIAVVVSAGNDFFVHDSQQGMGYPGIFRETVSVGAVFDANEGGFTYGSGASCQSSAPDQMTPFSQRLHASVSAATSTDIFAPGAPVTSSGINNDHGESIQHGTSQAAPVTAGVILLMQEYYLRKKGDLPAVDDIEEWLQRGAVNIQDDVGAADNVQNTNLGFLRIDAVGALSAIRQQFERDRYDGR